MFARMVVCSKNLLEDKIIVTFIDLFKIIYLEFYVFYIEKVTKTFSAFARKLPKKNLKRKI